MSQIPSEKVYHTYASQIIQAETREYLSQMSIPQIASSIEKLNSDLRERLTKRLQERTPYKVRFVGITGITFPKLITDAQENAAERRERIEQENAQLQVSKVALKRQLQEAQLTRKIEEEKALTEANAQKMLASTVDPQVLKLRQLENERAWIEKWDGKLPVTAMGDAIPMVNIK
jgi:regulator of protease activity HflC (stomatin/prohibitin superfamily)